MLSKIPEKEKVQVDIWLYGHKTFE